MGSSSKKIFVVIFIFLGIAALLFFALYEQKPPATTPVIETPATTSPLEKTIGTSVEGRAIKTYTYGTGTKHLVFVGGIHGGYEWNSVLLAYQFMDYLAANPAVVPASLRITIIPSLNPDAVFDVTGKEGRFVAIDATTTTATLEAARFNANGIDLNRNFDCKWQPTSMWRSKEVSAGTAVFSEPEAKAFADFALAERPAAVVFWHSQAATVYASFCENGILPVTDAIYKAYASAAGYDAQGEFTAYEITGDSGDWLAKMGIPAITVELTDHENTDWQKNLKGIQALFNYFK